MNEDPKPEHFSRGEYVELTSYHRMGGRYGRPSSRYFAPGLRGKVLLTEPDPERGQLLHVRYEHGPPAPLYADEVKRTSLERVRAGHAEELPTLEQRIGFIREILEERRQWAAWLARRGREEHRRRAEEQVLSEEEAAALVGGRDLSDLTDGEDGTAQQLIDRLLS